jgi:hypothetical protein
MPEGEVGVGAWRGGCRKLAARERRIQEVGAGLAEHRVVLHKPGEWWSDAGPGSASSARHRERQAISADLLTAQPGAGICAVGNSAARQEPRLLRDPPVRQAVDISAARPAWAPTSRRSLDTKGLTSAHVVSITPGAGFRDAAHERASDPVDDARAAVTELALEMPIDAANQARRTAWACASSASSHTVKQCACAIAVSVRSKTSAMRRS